MGSHTPGPWKQDYTRAFAGLLIRDSQGRRVAEASLEADAEANARLIAAAPELLEALARLKSEVIKHGWAQMTLGDAAEMQVRAALDQASDVIARATGGQP